MTANLRFDAHKSVAVGLLALWFRERVMSPVLATLAGLPGYLGFTTCSFHLTQMLNSLSPSVHTPRWDGPQQLWEVMRKKLCGNSAAFLHFEALG
jgi:hypothetical protein